MPDKITFTELRALLDDPSTEPEALRRYVTENADMSRPFAPAIVIDESKVDDEGRESALVLNFFNNWSRRYRHRKYEEKIKAGWPGRRFVSEGDSWFQYPSCSTM